MLKVKYGQARSASVVFINNHQWVKIKATCKRDLDDTIFAFECKKKMIIYSFIAILSSPTIIIIIIIIFFILLNP